jgi:DNA-binding NarL/FixJ family response regulator
VTPPIRVGIVEDNDEVRAGLTWLFGQSPGFQCVDACGSGEEALDRLPPHQPDVVLLEIRLPGRSGIDCLPELRDRCPAAQIGILTMFEDDDLIFGSLTAGATGYLLKTTPPAGLLEAVRDLHAGGSPMSSQIARRLVQLLMDHPHLRPRAIPGSPEGSTSSPPFPQLRPRERQILDLLAQGFLYKEIAQQLGISIDTVRTFIRSTYRKLDVHSRTEAVNRARDNR